MRATSPRSAAAVLQTRTSALADQRPSDHNTGPVAVPPPETGTCSALSRMINLPEGKSQRYLVLPYFGELACHCILCHTKDLCHTKNIVDQCPGVHRAAHQLPLPHQPAPERRTRVATVSLSTIPFAELREHTPRIGTAWFFRYFSILLGHPAFLLVGI